MHQTFFILPTDAGIGKLVIYTNRQGEGNRKKVFAVQANISLSEDIQEDSVKTYFLSRGKVNNNIYCAKYNTNNFYANFGYSTVLMDISLLGSYTRFLFSLIN